jgi:hypothetical protein
MAYEYVNGTLAGENLAYFFVYANSVTHELFGLFMVLSFFLVVLIGSAFAQLRTTGRLRPETSFLAASFVTLGFATILEQYSGILSANNFVILIAMTIIGIIWVVMSSNE